MGTLSIEIEIISQPRLFFGVTTVKTKTTTRRNEDKRHPRTARTSIVPNFVTIFIFELPTESVLVNASVLESNFHYSLENIEDFMNSRSSLPLLWNCKFISLSFIDNDLSCQYMFPGTELLYYNHFLESTKLLALY